MSKTAQRKLSAFQEGFRDARNGGLFRWERHPYLDHYRAGYEKGLEPAPKPINGKLEIKLILIGVAIGLACSIGLFIK